MHCLLINGEEKKIEKVDIAGKNKMRAIEELLDCPIEKIIVLDACTLAFLCSTKDEAHGIIAALADKRVEFDGRSVVIGQDRDGNLVQPTMTLDELRQLVVFYPQPTRRKETATKVSAQDGRH